jgi:hypothetical protein
VDLVFWSVWFILTAIQERKIFIPISLVFPWETKSNSGHLAINQAPFCQISIVIFRFMLTSPYFDPSGLFGLSGPGEIVFKFHWVNLFGLTCLRAGTHRQAPQ